MEEKQDLTSRLWCFRPVFGSKIDDSEAWKETQQWIRPGSVTALAASASSIRSSTSTRTSSEWPGSSKPRWPPVRSSGSGFSPTGARSCPLDGLSFQIPDRGGAITAPLGVPGLSGSARLQFPGAPSHPDYNVMINPDVLEFLRSR